ncbi:hypothetical protein E2C01_087518 [Portunus trituberculatus]|uniref:Uncharacterized protein n=1 Tax=Portunus trituberculatus TaxID=210409 RepID=A0A5B7JBZ3_PORTR|nr:hypothetical protein [Portunus trituberculatus]
MSCLFRQRCLIHHRVLVTGPQTLHNPSTYGKLGCVVVAKYRVHVVPTRGEWLEFHPDETSTLLQYEYYPALLRHRQPATAKGINQVFPFDFLFGRSLHYSTVSYKQP